jgi:hypothetical protein
MKQKFIDFLNVFQGLRKSIIMLLLMIIGVWFRLKGYLSGDNFVELFKATVISYFGANSIEHFTAMVQQHLASKSGATAVVADPEAITVEAEPEGASNGK